MSDAATACVEAVVVMVLMLAAVLSGCRAGLDAGVRQEQQKAVESGVGRWQIDPATGERYFVYGKE